MPDDPRVLKQLDRIEEELRDLRMRLNNIESVLFGEEQAEASPVDLEAGEREAQDVIPPVETLEETSADVHAEEVATPPTMPESVEERLQRPVHEKPEVSGSKVSEAETAEEEHAGWDWSETLRQWKILPPKDDKRTIEVMIGTWWAPRIAILLFVMSIVSIAIYFSQRTSAPLRFAGVLGTSIGVSLLGYLLERRNIREFGSMLFGTGLALTYFTVFAGYAIPAVKVIYDPAAASALQFVVVLAIIACSLWRDSQLIATLAVLFGFFACFFSFTTYLHSYALVASLLLGVAGSVLYLLKSWVGPYQIAIPGSYLLYACILVFHWDREPRYALAFVRALAFPFVSMLLFLLTDFVAFLRKRLMAGEVRTYVQILNTSAALLLGYYAIQLLELDHLSTFYFTFGGVLAVAGLGYYLLKNPDAVAQAYFIKGTALLTLGLMAELGGNARWLALLAEGFVLLFGARRSRLASVEAAMAAVWYASLYYFFRETFESFSPDPGEAGAPFPFTSATGAFSVLYLVASAVLLALEKKWLARRGESIFDETNPSIRPFFEFISAIALGAVAVAVTIAVGDDTYIVAHAMLYAAVLAGIGLSMHAWAPVMSASIAYAFGYGAFVLLKDQPDEFMSLRELWMNAASIIAVSAAILAALQWRLRQSAKQDWIHAAQLILNILWILALHFCFDRMFADKKVLCLVDLGLAFGLAASALVVPLATLADASAWALVLVLLRVMNPDGGRGLDPLPQGVFLWTLVILPFVYALGFYITKPLREKTIVLASRQAIHWVHLILAGLIGVFLLRMVYSDARLMFIMALLSIPIMAMRIWPGMKAGTYVGLAYLLLCYLIFANDFELVGANLSFLGSSVFVGIVTIGYAVSLLRTEREWAAITHRNVQFAFGGMALAVVFTAFYRQTGELRNYITVFWGICACAIFLAGLLARMKPLRVVGLAGLAICISRVFIVDIRSTLYRIAAFIVLCAVLLVVGYLYNRFAGMIDRADKA